MSSVKRLPDPPSPGGRARRSAPEASERRLEILDTAIGILNARGASAQMIDLVASRNGLDRASLYYYVGGREELIFSAYRRSYDLLMAYLDAAWREGGDALDRLERLIRKIVCSATPVASLNEIGLLTEEHRRIIDDLRTAYWRRLTDLIAAGRKDGSLAPFDPELAARAVEGALTLATQWLREEMPQDRESLASSIADVMFHGRREPGSAFDPDYARPSVSILEAVHAAQANATPGDQKREAMLMVATRLINEKGVSGMTLEDIVRSLGVTKGAFYHYFESKDDLIFRCYTRSQVMTERYISMVEDQGGSGLGMLQQATYHNFAIQLSPIGPLTLFTGYGALPDELHQLIRSRAAVGSAAMREFAYRGIEDGSIRPHPVRIGQRVFGGSSTWLPTWRSPADGLTLQDVADTFIPLYSNGLKRRPRRGR